MIHASENELGTVRDILRKHFPGARVWVFGSRCRDVHKPYSDLDLAILGEDGSSLPADALNRAHEAFMASDLPYRVDLLDYNAASPAFRENVDNLHEEITLLSTLFQRQHKTTLL
jgi:predicted nucleotidyltransferase